jgi:dihydropteroate synthase
VTDIHRYLQHRRDALTASGLAMDQLALDPGIGFGKTHQHNLELVAGCHTFHDLGCPLLVGHSRKGFIGKVIGNAKADRTAGNLGVALALAQQGVQVLRVHDVAATRQALLLYDAVGGLTGQPLRLPS